MSRGMIYIVAISILMFGGCSTKNPPMKRYLLEPDFSFGRVHSRYSDSSIKISYPNDIIGRSGTNIYYSYNKLEDDSYQNSSWSSSSSQLISSVIVRALEHGKVFDSIVDYRSISTTDYLLESEIYHLYHKIRKDISLSIVAIRFDLIDLSNNRLVKSRRFSYKIPTKSIDAIGYVEATNIALERLSRDLVEWLAK